MNSAYFTHDQPLNVIYSNAFLCATHRKLISRPLNFERRRWITILEAQGQKAEAERGENHRSGKERRRCPEEPYGDARCASSKWQLYINIRGNIIHLCSFCGHATFWNMISEAFLHRLPFVLYAWCEQRAERPSSRLNYGLFDPFKRQTATDAAHKTKNSQYRRLLYILYMVCACGCLSRESFNG